jgi:predicted  nucleic acid-binding Zn ribbon protein
VSFGVKVALSLALETKSQCPKCKKGHWLTEEDLKLPWE